MIDLVWSPDRIDQYWLTTSIYFLHVFQPLVFAHERLEYGDLGAVWLIHLLRKTQ